MSIVIHLAGLACLLVLMRVHKEGWMTPRALFNQSIILVGVGFGLFALHTLEIWAYALLYHLLQATKTFEEALYFSTVTYATIGYGDLTLRQEWRILGAIEGANGIILLGWSTAFFVSVVARLGALEHDWLRTERA